MIDIKHRGLSRESIGMVVEDVCYDGYWAREHYFKMKNAMFAGNDFEAARHATEHVRHCRRVAESVGVEGLGKDGE